MASRTRAELAAQQVIDRVLGGLSAELDTLKERFGELRTSIDGLNTQLGNLRSSELSALEQRVRVEIAAQAEVSDKAIANLMVLVRDQHSKTTSQIEASGKQASAAETKMATWESAQAGRRAGLKDYITWILFALTVVSSLVVLLRK